MKVEGIPLTDDGRVDVREGIQSSRCLENSALRGKLSSGQVAPVASAGVASFMMSTSPERESEELDHAYDFEDALSADPSDRKKPKESKKPDKVVKRPAQRALGLERSR